MKGALFFRRKQVLKIDLLKDQKQNNLIYIYVYHLNVELYRI